MGHHDCPHRQGLRGEPCLHKHGKGTASFLSLPRQNEVIRDWNPLSARRHDGVQIVVRIVNRKSAAICRPQPCDAAV